MVAVTSRLRLPVWAQDTLLALFVVAMQVQGTRRVATEQDLAELDPFGTYAHAVLLVLTGLVLVFRRRWPVAVFLAQATASVWYYGAGYPDGPNWVAVFVALYTLTAYGDGHRSRRIATGGVALLVVSWLAAAAVHPPNDVGWLFFRIGTAVMAAVLGESVRMGRVLAAEAQERADRAERTREEEARRRVDAERLHIAREVHDTVAHAIAIINVQAGVTAHVLDKRPSMGGVAGSGMAQQARETLLTIEQTSARALRELRATLGVLRQADEGRAPASGLDRIEELTSLARDAGLDVKVEVSTPSHEARRDGTEPAPVMPRELPGPVDRAAYRILQESITNVIRHAGPARVTVGVEYGPQDLRIRVTDDGCGGRTAGRPEAVDGAGRGIAGMRERCALLGGELTAGPRASGGFEVHARLPLPLPATEPV
jgi:signal transduction histidine kinase